MPTLRKGDIVEWSNAKYHAEFLGSVGVVRNVGLGVDIDWITMTPSLQRAFATMGVDWVETRWMHECFTKITEIT